MEELAWGLPAERDGGAPAGALAGSAADSGEEAASSEAAGKPGLTGRLKEQVGNRNSGISTCRSGQKELPTSRRCPDEQRLSPRSTSDQQSSKP